MLKIRLPPSLRIDTSPDHTQNMISSKRSTHELYKYTNNNGMLGSVTASGIDDELYLVGSCDNSHTFSFDVDICSRSGDVDTYVSIDGVTDFRLKACVQTSFAYTSVVKSRGEWITVRRLRVTTNELELTDNVETLTSSLDSEVLAVVSQAMFLWICVFFLNVNFSENKIRSKPYPTYIHPCDSHTTFVIAELVSQVTREFTAEWITIYRRQRYELVVVSSIILL